MPYLGIFLSVLVSAGVSAFMIPRIILISFKKRLFDHVDERKVHHGIVPRLGGVAFTPSIVISIALLFGFYVLFGNLSEMSPLVLKRLPFFLCALLLIYLEGITDDLKGVGYKLKFAFHTIGSTIIVSSGVCLNNLHGLLGIHTIPVIIGFPLSVILMVFIINALNMIDGIDGLASGLTMVTTFFLGCLFFENGYFVYSSLSFSTFGMLVPFFIYNVFGQADRHNKIFMGDCGSQTIGLIIGFLALSFAISPARESLLSPGAPLTIAFSVLLIPCLDVLRVMFGRLYHRRNPFLPDKTHIHHKLLALGMSHRTTMVTILALDSFFILLNFGLLTFININFIILLDILIFCALQWGFSRLKKTVTVT